MRAPQPFNARLTEAWDLSPSVRNFVFERTDGELDFDPGQWVNLFLPDGSGGELKRAYSIASAPARTNRFELCVTLVPHGAMSNALYRLPIGSEARFVGPHGLFTRDAHDPTPALLVATGSGLAPLRSMMAASLAGPAPAKMRLLFGVRTQADVLYAQELEQWAAAGTSVSITLSRGARDWQGLRGYVQHHVPAVWAELGEPSAHVYICGLQKMVDEVKAVCRGALAMGRKQVHAEKFD